MTDSESTSAESRNPHLPTSGKGKSEIALRRQEAQALNRSFRRVAEVQQALLEYIHELEDERHSRRRWALPMASGGAVVFGAGLAFLAFQWQADLEAERLEAFLPQAASIVVEPAPVSIQVPASAIDEQAVASLLAEMTSLREFRDQDRETIAALNTRLLESEERQLAFLRTVAAMPGIETRPSPASDSWPFRPEYASFSELETTPEPDGEPQPWLDSLNSLMAADGYPWLRFRKGAFDPGGTRLTDVVLFEWSPEGPLRGALVAEEVDLELQVMTSTLILKFNKGHRLRSGKRIPFSSSGFRLDLAGIRPEVWLEQFPALGVRKPDTGTAASVETSVPDPNPDSPLDKAIVQEAINKFLTVRRPAGYYRLTQLGGVLSDRLERVQIDWYNGSGRLVKTLAADSLKVILHASGSVELLLTHGAFLEAGLRRPFFLDRFRLHLPRQNPEDWRASPIPLSDGAL